MADSKSNRGLSRRPHKTPTLKAVVEWDDMTTSILEVAKAGFGAPAESLVPGLHTSALWYGSRCPCQIFYIGDDDSELKLAEKRLHSLLMKRLEEPKQKPSSSSAGKEIIDEAQVHHSQNQPESGRTKRTITPSNTDASHLNVDDETFNIILGENLTELVIKSDVWIGRTAKYALNLDANRDPKKVTFLLLEKYLSDEDMVNMSSRGKFGKASIPQKLENALKSYIRFHYDAMLYEYNTGLFNLWVNTKFAVARRRYYRKHPDKKPLPDPSKPPRVRKQKDKSSSSTVRKSPRKPLTKSYFPSVRKIPAAERKLALKPGTKSRRRRDEPEKKVAKGQLKRNKPQHRHKKFVKELFNETDMESDSALSEATDESGSRIRPLSSRSSSADSEEALEFKKPAIKKRKHKL